MKIKSKIIAFQFFFIGVVILMAAVVYFAIRRADNYIERITHAYRQLETITSLSLHANRYSEQIAEMLLFGKEGRASSRRPTRPGGELRQARGGHDTRDRVPRQDDPGQELATSAAS